MKIYRVKNEDEYKIHVRKMSSEYSRYNQFEDRLLVAQQGQEQFTLHGYSYTAGQMVDFIIDYISSYDGRPNWRERVICPITGLNNRVRAIFHMLDIEIAPYVEDQIYISEQVTPSYAFLRLIYPLNSAIKTSLLFISI